MAQNKTIENMMSVEDFLNAIQDEKKRKECFELIEISKEITGSMPKMWGTSIVGFGSHHYKYASGREGDSPNFSFSPRPSSIVLYFWSDSSQRNELLSKLGKHKAEKACIHIKSLADIDQSILKQMKINHLQQVQELYG